MLGLRARVTTVDSSIALTSVSGVERRIGHRTHALLPTVSTANERHDDGRLVTRVPAGGPQSVAPLTERRTRHALGARTGTPGVRRDDRVGEACASAGADESAG